MRFRIDKPCFIDTEGPVTITPIYQSGRDFPYHCGQCDERFATGRDRLGHWDKTGHQPKANVPRETAKEYVARTKPKSKRRTKGKNRRFKMRCNYCMEVFLGAGRARYCSDSHRHAHARTMGHKYPFDTEGVTWKASVKPIKVSDES